MLEIPRAVRDALVAHARRDHPDEACGVVAGRDGRATRVIEMANAERSPTFYRFDSAEQLQVWRAMEEAGEEPVVIYHSHTATEAYPSRTDIALATEPAAHYVLLSTVLLSTGGEPGGPVDFRSFRIVAGEVTEEEVRILDEPAPAG